MRNIRFLGDIYESCRSKTVSFPFPDIAVRETGPFTHGTPLFRPPVRGSDVFAHGNLRSQRPADSIYKIGPAEARPKVKMAVLLFLSDYSRRISLLVGCQKEGSGPIHVPSDIRTRNDTDSRIAS